MGNQTNGIDEIIEHMLQEWKRSMLTFWTLGLLVSRPMYGLEIKMEIEQSTQGALPVLPSTIYQMMARLEKRGLVTKSQEKTTIGPPRTYYHLTPAGREVLRRYIAEILTPDSPIYTGLSQMTAQLIQQLGKEKK
ncbi:MAG: PadR family transcriptional regulator [Chloroflexota bacterium]|nr:MAG: PadR family transcriptional regulator [Chloroflexota bacterium]